MLVSPIACRILTSEVGTVVGELLRSRFVPENRPFEAFFLRGAVLY